MDKIQPVLKGELQRKSLTSRGGIVSPLALLIGAFVAKKKIGVGFCGHPSITAAEGLQNKDPLLYDLLTKMGNLEFHFQVGKKATHSRACS